MSASVNKVILVGNIGQKPIVRVTPKGRTVTKLSLATHENTQQQNHTEWHKIVVLDELAASLRRSFHAGAKVYIEGKIQTRSYTDKSGQERRITEIIASDLIWLDAPAPSNTVY